jgi:hypothetical protein
MTTLGQSWEIAMKGRRKGGREYAVIRSRKRPQDPEKNEKGVRQEANCKQEKDARKARVRQERLDRKLRSV